MYQDTTRDLESSQDHKNTYRSSKPRWYPRMSRQWKHWMRNQIHKKPHHNRLHSTSHHIKPHLQHKAIWYPSPIISSWSKSTQTWIASKTSAQDILQRWHSLGVTENSSQKNFTSYFAVAISGTTPIPSHMKVMIRLTLAAPHYPR